MPPPRQPVRALHSSAVCCEMMSVCCVASARPCPVQRRDAALDSVSKGIVQVGAGASVPATLQGDLSLYSDEALDMRLRLRLSPTLMNAIQQVGTLVPAGEGGVALVMARVVKCGRCTQLVAFEKPNSKYI